VRVSLDGGKTWVKPDSVVVRPDGTFAWAMSTNTPPGKVTVGAAIVNPQTNATVKTDLVAAVQVSNKPPEVVAAARAVEPVKQQPPQPQQSSPTSERQKSPPASPS